MIERITPYFSAEDNRGSITGLVNFGHWGEFNVIQTKKGVVRGNHYHKETIELFYIIKGELEFTTQKVKDNKPIGEKVTEIFKESDIFKINPGTIHVVKTLSDCEWINILSKPIDPKAPDFHVPE